MDNKFIYILNDLWKIYSNQRLSRNDSLLSYDLSTIHIATTIAATTAATISIATSPFGNAMLSIVKLLSSTAISSSRLFVTKSMELATTTTIPRYLQ